MGGAAAGTKWFQHLRRLSSSKVSAEAVERGQSRVIDASFTLIRERAKLKVPCVLSPVFVFYS
jgi:arginase